MYYKKSHQVFIFVALCVAILFNGVSLSFAEDLTTTDEALKKVFSQATHFDSKNLALSDAQVKVIEEKARILFKGSHSTSIQMYIAKEDGQTLGFAFEDKVIGKWGPIHYLVGLNAKGTILQVIILDYQEIRGKPIAKRRFLRQYKKKSIDDPVKLRRDIDGVTGATISSRSLTNGIRKILFIFQEFKGTMSDF